MTDIYDTQEAYFKRRAMFEAAAKEAAKIKVTPGAWEAHINENGCVYVTSDFAAKGDICDLYHKGTDGNIYTKDNAESNAHLIACAPDMYAMLQEIYDNLLYKNAGRGKQIAELLKKARGE